MQRRDTRHRRNRKSTTCTRWAWWLQTLYIVSKCHNWSKPSRVVASVAELVAEWESELALELVVALGLVSALESVEV